MQSIIFSIVALIILSITPSFIGWCIHKIKYPILSDTPPMGILQDGDEVYIRGKRYRYNGMSNNNNIYYHFMAYDSVSDTMMTLFQTLKGLQSVKGRHGYKWRKTTNEKRLNYLVEYDRKDTTQFEI